MTTTIITTTSISKTFPTPVYVSVVVVVVVKNTRRFNYILVF